MMPQVHAILAETDDSVKLIIGVVVAVIWGVGALISAANKKQKAENERRQTHENWERIQREMHDRAARATAALSRPPGEALRSAPPVPPAPPPLPHLQHPAYHPAPPPPPVFAPTRSIDTRPALARPVPMSGRAVAARPMPSRPVQRPVQRPAPSAAQRQPRKQKQPPSAPAAGPAVPPIPSAARASDRPARAHDPGAANAAALSKWLSAKTLRSQFILTEILQPPLALREPRG